MKTKSIILFKKIISKSLIIMAIFIISCKNNELETQLKQQKSVLIEGNKISVLNNTLSFKDQISFDNILQSLKNIKTENTQGSLYSFVSVSVVNKKNQFEGFKSMYDLYNEALNNADYYYQKENGYQEFKDIYKQLYFPEYKDDYSVYLPVNDEELAKLLNPNGDVLINGKLVNMKNVNTYTQLQKLGIAMYGLSTRKIERLTPDPGSIVAPNLVLDQVYYLNKIKYWLSAEDNNDNPITLYLNFRKKGFLGFWYNLSANSQCTLSIYPLGRFYNYWNVNDIQKFYPSTYGAKSPHVYNYYNQNKYDPNVADFTFEFKIDEQAGRPFMFKLK